MDDDERVSVSEVINKLKSAFRPKHFEEAERIFTAREDRYLREIEKLEKDKDKYLRENVELKKDVAAVEQRLSTDSFGVEVELRKRALKDKMAVEEMKTAMAKLEERQAIDRLIHLAKEKELEAEAATWKEKFQEVENWVLALEQEAEAMRSDGVFVSDKKASGGKGSGDGGTKLVTEGTILIIGGDDECNSAKVTASKEKASESSHAKDNVVVRTVNDMLKRKRDSFVSLYENNADGIQPDQHWFSSSDSDDDSSDCDSLVRQVLSYSEKKAEACLQWESESLLLCDLNKDIELCMRAVCALYRQEILAGKSPNYSPVSKNQGSDQSSALRELAMFLTDGDPQRKLNKSLDELRKHDPRGPENCRKLAKSYRTELYEIHKKKQDQLFP